MLNTQMKIQHELTVQSEAIAARVHSQPSTDADVGAHTSNFHRFSSVVLHGLKKNVLRDLVS